MERAWLVHRLVRGEREGQPGRWGSAVEQIATARVGGVAPARSEEEEKRDGAALQGRARADGSDLGDRRQEGETAHYGLPEQGS